MIGLRAFLRDVWRLAKPYYSSDEKWSAWCLLGSILALRLDAGSHDRAVELLEPRVIQLVAEQGLVGLFELLFVYRHTPSGFMPGFCGIAAYIVVAVYFTYLSQWLQMRWRRWLTVRFLDEWLSDRAYYRISLTADRAAIGTDNPDQRIAEDIRDFVDNTLILGVSILANAVSLVSFLGILWSLSGTISLFGIAIPGYMVWVALGYAILGTWLTHVVGRQLAVVTLPSAAR
jgi:vitamin B12/bleomycin/antimicrobial peptide transport system ATP-binding/permease protein